MYEDEHLESDYEDRYVIESDTITFEDESDESDISDIWFGPYDSDEEDDLPEWDGEDMTHNFPKDLN